MLTRRVHFFAAFALAAGAATLPACSAFRPVRNPVTISDPANAAGKVAYAVHVDNRLGNVRVEVDPSLTRPVVTADIKGKLGPEPAPWAAAALEPSTIAPVLRVLAAKPDAPAIPTDITVRIPVCAGVTVRTVGGWIELNGVRGAIEAESGSEVASGGPITITPGGPLDAPLLVRTPTGPVTLRLPRGSAGVLDAATERGNVEVNVHEGNAMTHAEAHASRWRGVLNGGTSDMRIWVGKGDIRIRVGD